MHEAVGRTTEDTACRPHANELEGSSNVTDIKAPDSGAEPQMLLSFPSPHLAMYFSLETAPVSAPLCLPLSSSWFQDPRT